MDPRGEPVISTWKRPCQQIQNGSEFPELVAQNFRNPQHIEIRMFVLVSSPLNSASNWRPKLRTLGQIFEDHRIIRPSPGRNVLADDQHHRSGRSAGFWNPLAAALRTQAVAARCTLFDRRLRQLYGGAFFESSCDSDVRFHHRRSAKAGWLMLRRIVLLFFPRLLLWLRRPAQSQAK